MTAGSHLHVALGDCAGTALKEACAKLGLPGAVFTIPDDLSNGPLHDGQVRAAYWRELVDGELDGDGNALGDAVPDDVFGCWRELTRGVSMLPQPTVVLWFTDAVSDMTFVRMACCWLRDFSGPIECINMTPVSGLCGLGMHEPADLLGGFATRIALDSHERESLAADFIRLSDDAGGLRMYQNGQIATWPADRLDETILSYVSDDWQPAAGAVGCAMGFADEHDRIGDSFFFWRIRGLIAGGRVEAKGDQRQRSFQIRRPLRNL